MSEMRKLMSVVNEGMSSSRAYDRQAEIEHLLDLILGDQSINRNDKLAVFDTIAKTASRMAVGIRRSIDQGL